MRQSTNKLGVRPECRDQPKGTAFRLLTASFRYALCSSRRGLPRSRLLHRRLFDSGLFRRCRLLCAPCLRLRSFGPLQRPPLLRSGDNRLPASRRKLPFGFGGRFWGWRFSRLLGCSPTLPLCFGDPGTAAALILLRLRSCGCGATAGLAGPPESVSRSSAI
jgi:hypothetical protein